MKRIILSMMLAAAAMCGWSAEGDNKLKVKLDLVDFGDSVVVIQGEKVETFVGKNGKFEFELQVDTIRYGYIMMQNSTSGS